MPLVSVILPVHNGACTIERAVRSILGQTVQDIELVVADDGSTDNTREVLNRIDDTRVRVIHHEHRGVARTANRALARTRSRFVARMDADDVSHPTRLEKQLRLLRQQNLDVAGCQVRICDADGYRVPSMARYERWINEETLDSQQIHALRFVELPVVNPTILARREYFELGFRATDLPEDYDLMLRAASLGMRFAKVDEILFDWVDRPDRLTRSDPRYSTDAFTCCRREHLLAGPLNRVGMVDLWGVGKTGKPWLRWLQTQGITVRHAYDVDDRKIGRSIHGVRIRHPGDLPAAVGTPLIVAVGADGARDAILPRIHGCGYVPGRDAWFVA